mmetsp:Transcript_125362/g.228186  ORF Transcript_125362/g.228186 Transcript_125362/m.228186 type:complete len:261 (+) Transcript_125362:55-837(+)
MREYMALRIVCTLCFLASSFVTCNEKKACARPGCMIEEEMPGLQMLQVKASSKSQPTEECPLPDSSDFQAKGKRCPPDEDQRGLDTCLNSNKPFETMADAWKACSTVPDCDQVMQHTDARWYLRRGSDPEIEGEGMKLYSYTCMPEWLSKAFIKTENALCGWSDADGNCQMNNYAYINGGQRSATNIDRAAALVVCGRMCKLNSTDCGGFFWNATERACFFRKNARCGLDVSAGHDCYARETDGDLAIEHVLFERNRPGQ